MLWMLDTDICSYILKDHPAPVKARLNKVGMGQVSLSVVVLAELYFGAVRHAKATDIRDDIDDLVSRLTVLAWDQPAADHYGRIRAHLEEQGEPIGNMDLMIAAHARSLDATLVTNNVKHFRRVPGLKLENWI